MKKVFMKVGKIKWRNGLLCFFLCCCLFSASAPSPVVGERYGIPVDIVFALDLSGSTNGMINRMRNHLWDYVYLLSRCYPKAYFRIGFVGIGRPSFGADNSYVKVLSDLTRDMEGLSFNMFEMKTNIEKGDQFIGAALNTCAKKISWSPDTNALKVVIMAGNGLVTTGSENWEKAAILCASKGIIVNTIYVVNRPNPKEEKGWEDIATITKGKFTSLQLKNEYYENLGGFDMTKLWSLNKKLDNTYLYYGPIGKERARMQRSVDENMYTANSEGYRYRLQFRISDLYLNKNAEWDLVDLYTKSPVAILACDKATMPDTLKFMPDADLRTFVIFNKYRRRKLVNDIKQQLFEKEQIVKAKKLEVDKLMRTLDIVASDWLRPLIAAKGYSCN